MGLQHPDAAVNAMIQSLETQRDSAVVQASNLAQQLAQATADLVAANKRIEELDAAVQAAAQFQSNVIPIEGSAA